MEKQYNAKIKILFKDHEKMVFRVFPDNGIMLRYLPGQYGSLGLYSDTLRIDGAQKEPQTVELIKRAYSLSTSIIERGKLIDLPSVGYYEYYIDLVTLPEQTFPRLSARLFTLQDGDSIFVGPKIVGHYTLAARAHGRNIVFVSALTGEAPHNSMINQALNEGVSIAHIIVAEKEWVSPYLAQHQAVMQHFSNYKCLTIDNDPHYETLGNQIKKWYLEPDSARIDLGFALDANCHFFLCGDPIMIGAPRKLGGWQYEYPDYGLMRILEGLDYKPATRFEAGSISFEAYW